MSKEQENPSAFPYDEINHNGEPGEIYRQHVGLTMRDYFAAKAMQALITNFSHFVVMSKINPDGIAQVSYNFADKMLLSREAKTTVQ